MTEQDLVRECECPRCKRKFSEPLRRGRPHTYCEGCREPPRRKKEVPQ